MSQPTRLVLPLTSDCAFWASLLLSWVAQESDGLLSVSKPAIWFFAVAALCLVTATIGAAFHRPWHNGSMKLSPNLAKLMFVTMIALTAAWVFIAIAHTQTPNAQILYCVCASLTGWAAMANFITIRDFEKTDHRGA